MLTMSLASRSPGSKATCPMKADFVRVVENTRLYGDTYVMWLAGAELMRGATPGQFVMLRCGDVVTAHPEPFEGAAGALTGASLADDPLLPRAMSYHRLRDGAN